MSLSVAVLAAVAVVVVIALAVGLLVTGQPTFLKRYPIYARSYATLASSAHKGMTCGQCHATGGLGYRLALVGDFYASAFQRDAYAPTFSKLAQPTRAACLACHSHDWSMDSAKTSKVPHPAHLRVATETRDCVTCHRWIGHEETYMQQHTKMPFSVVCASFGCHVGWKQPNDCKNCHHQLQVSLGVWKQVHPQVVHTVGANACLEKCHTADQCRLCHTTGKMPVFAKTIAASTVTTIEVAHVKSDWLTQHGTFAMQDKTKCLTCHVTFQECEDCHSVKPAFHGTDNTAWIGTGHEKYAKLNPKRCFECHKPTECNSCHTQFQAQSAPQYPANAGQ